MQIDIAHALQKVSMHLGVENGRVQSKRHIVFWMEDCNLNTVQEHGVYYSGINLTIEQLTITHLGIPWCATRVNVRNMFLNFLII